MNQQPPPIEPEDRPGPPVQVVGYAARPGKTTQLATTALVLGFLAIIPALGVLFAFLALVEGTIVLATRRPGRKRAIAGMALAVVLASTVCVLSMYWHRLAMEQVRQVHCAFNLGEIGKCVELYRSDNHDQPPTDLHVLVAAGLVGPGMLQCAGNPGAMVGFFYLPRPASAGPACIVACDWRDNHKGKGRNVLYHDGAVKWLSIRDFQAELADPINADFAAALRLVEGP